MKDYLIKIHRREKNDPRKLVGVVEEVGAKRSRAFSNVDELWEILNSSKAKAAKTKKRNEKPPRPRKGERIEVRGKPPGAHPHPYPLPPAGEGGALFLNESLKHRKEVKVEEIG